MIRKISFQFIRKVIGWSLFVLMVLFIITGLGITQFRTVERITLGLLGVSIVTLARPLLPLGLAFAAGAMLFVVADELIPESHRKGHERAATFGLIAGFVIMMVLDTVLG